MGRKEKKYHFIYKTTNTLSSRYYIGMHSTNDLEDGYLGSGTRLRRSIRKYGKDNFIREIIEYCKDRKELANRESEVVTLNEIAKEECINLKVGGEGGFSREIQSMGGSATLKILHERYKNDITYKNKMDEISIRNLKKSTRKDVINNRFTDKKHSEETKRKMSESKKNAGLGVSNSQYGTMWITNDIENKKIEKNGIIPAGWRKGRIIKK